MLRGVWAAGLVLCYGNNNGGACAEGSVHPLAPNLAQSSPRLSSYLLTHHIHSLAFCLPPLQLFPLRVFRFPLLSVSPAFLAHTHASCLFLHQSLLSISPFLLPHKGSHSPVALKQKRTKRPLKMQSLQRNASAVRVSAVSPRQSY